MTPPTELSQSAPEPRNSPSTPEIKLSKAESRRLLNKITADYDAALTDNQQRIERFRRHYRAWRKKLGPPPQDPLKPIASSNYRVPLITEKVQTKWAKIMDSFLGDDAEIVAQPTSPVDRQVAAKVGRYMTWQLFNHMSITEELAKFAFQEIVFGRAHAKCEYDVEYLDGPGSDIAYDGPRFTTLTPDQLIVPPSTNECGPNDFPWLAIRTWMTPDELLAMEADGHITGISDNFEKIVMHAKQREMATDGSDAIAEEQAAFQGVVTHYGASDNTRVEIREHYIGWRMLKGKKDGEYDDFDVRNKRETKLRVTYIADISIDGDAGLIISTKNCAQMYPKTKNRIPVVSASILKDGSYWPPPLPEQLEETEIEMSVNHNLMNDAGEKMVNPPIFAIPGMGLSPERTQVEPGRIYWTQDPKSTQQMEMRGNLDFCITRDQMLGAIAERVSGLPDQTNGRASDRPNQPRTFRGQALLLGQSDLRQQLELIFMSEDWSKILDHIKMLVDTYGPPEEEFRVTEEAASGFFETNRGFAKITAKERQGKYDFKLKFATSAQSREAHKERFIEFVGAFAPFPVLVQNANLQRDMMKLGAKLYQLEGLLPSLNAIPDSNIPMDPETEWVQMLQGIKPMINILDDDPKHIESHMAKLVEQQGLPEEDQDEQAIMLDIAHIMQHKEQQRLKMEMLAQAQATANAAAATGAVTGMLQGGAEELTGGQIGGGLAPLASLMGGGMGAADAQGGFQGIIGPTDYQGEL